MPQNNEPASTPMQTDETRAREVLGATKHADDCAMLTALHTDYCDCDRAIRAMLAFAAPPAVEREEHPALSAILAVRHSAASNFAPEFSGVKGEAYDRGVMDCYRSVEKALSSPTLHPSDREEGLREAAQAVVDNASRSYRSRGKDRYIEDESGELVMLVPHEDWYRLAHSLAAIMALSGSLAPANPTEKGEK